MSGAQQSGFANVLYDPLMAGKQQAQTNQLQMQQLDLTAADHEQVGRLAAGLLNEPDPVKRADLYARGVGMLQAQGLAKYAPPTLPDEGVLRSLVNQSVPVADQYRMGLGQSAAQGAISALAPGGNTSTMAAPGTTTGAAAPSSVPIPARGTGGPGASASAPTAWLPYFAEASKETGIPVDLLIAQARQESGFNPNATGQAGELGVFQIKPSTASSPGFGLPPVDPASIAGPDNVRNNILFGARYLKARMGSGDPTNPAVQAAGLHAYNGGGDPNYVQNVFRYRPTLAPSDPNAAVTAYTPPTAGATTAAAQPGATPPPTQYAGPGAPGAPTLPPAATETPPGPAQPPGATAAPVQPGQPQGPAAQAPPTPASVQPTAAPPAVPHLVTPNGQQVPPPPGGVAVLSNGLTPQQWGLVQNELRAASVAGPAAIAAVLEKVPQLAQQNTALNMAAWKAAHPELGKIETAQGSILYNPNTGETVGTIAHAPVPTTPRFTQGAGRYNPATTQYEPATPANANLGPAVLGHWGVNNAGQQTFFADDPAATQRQKAAEAAGTAAGGLAGKLVTQLAEQGSRANQAISTIDEGIDNVQKAQQAGLNTGYFAPWISTGLAMAKSLGVDTKVLAGIDPSAVGDIQTAKKTLGLVSGQILQQILGPESQITEGKIQHFIGSQPGIETDPQALGRVLNWARSQFVYEREQAAQGMEDARAPGAGGILQPDWLPNYYATKGFGPIYNPNVGAMQQPDGQAPGREPPVSAPARQTAPAATLPPKALSSLVEGHVTTFGNGQQWTLRNGHPVQVK